MSKKILVIDDEQSVCTLICTYLKEGGFDVIFANDGETGIVLARTENPDMIVLDLMMPNMPGSAVASALKCVPATCNIPVLFLSGAFEQDEARYIGNRFAGETLLTKPIKRDDLLAKVKSMLKK